MTPGVELVLAFAAGVLCVLLALCIWARRVVREAEAAFAERRRDAQAIARDINREFARAGVPARIEIPVRPGDLKAADQLIREVQS